MTFKLKITDGESTWVESFNEDTDNPRQWARSMIDQFNSTLRKGERRRIIKGIKIISTENITRHQWNKSCLVTQIKGGRSYDTYKCSRCGITGKRFGLSSRITRDSKYKAAKYDVCISPNSLPDPKRCKHRKSVEADDGNIKEVCKYNNNEECSSTFNTPLCGFEEQQFKLKEKEK